MLFLTIKEIKEYLNQAFTIQKIINAKKARIVYLKDMQNILGMSFLQDDVKQGEIEADIIKEMSDSIKICKNEIIRLFSLQNEIQDIIESVKDDNCRFLLFERYVLLKDWKQIREDNHYSEKHVFKIHKKALKLLEKIL